MQPFSGLLKRTPLAGRLVFGLCAVCYALFAWSHHLFVSLDLVCRPVDVIYGLQLHRLLLASFAHTSLLGLCLAVLVCWRRFAWLEHQYGTLGFVVWFLWNSVLLHGAYCVFAVSLAGVFDAGAASREVHGLFPLLTASLVAGGRDSDNAEVWLWPLPLHVPVRTLPLIVIALSWIFHWEAHYDVAVAFVVASVAPGLVEPDIIWLSNQVEQTPPGRAALAWLQSFDSFVCRPPSCGSGLEAWAMPVPCPLGTAAIVGKPRPAGDVGQGGISVQAAPKAPECYSIDDDGEVKEERPRQLSPGAGGGATGVLADDRQDALL